MAGVVVRAAAKITGVPVIAGGIRGKAAEHLSVSSSARMPFSARPSVSAITSGVEAADEPMPRVVFDGVPTLEEAKEATSELILGIEKIYPWSRGDDEYGNSVTAKHELDSSNSQVEQAKASASGEITTEPVVSPAVYTAFRLLRESSMARNVVCSLACDPNILKAVRQNQEFQELMDSEKRRWAERLCELHEESMEDPRNDEESNQGSSFEDLLNRIKGMIKNGADMFKKLFEREEAMSSADGDHAGSPESSADGDHAGSPAPGHVIEASLLGLAIMVIMVIFLKRR